jgi:cell wall-associated NlpC family hydrolase
MSMPRASASLRPTVSHVGIYLGEGRFIHAASRSRKVKISGMEQRYFARRLVSVCRYLPE